MCSGIEHSGRRSHLLCSPYCLAHPHRLYRPLSRSGVVLYEYLGEEYPEVLGSILGALKSIVNVIGMTKVRQGGCHCGLG